MIQKNKSYFLIIFLFCLATAASWNLYFRQYIQKDTVDIKSFPMAVGDWTAEDLPISEADYDILETRNAFTRKYTDPGGNSVYLFVVYSQSNRKISHPPEICYTGSGVSILDNTHDSVPVASENLVIDVNRLLLSRGASEHVAFYWFKVGKAFTPNYWKQQGLIATKTLLGQSTSSALIRVSAEVLNGNKAETVQNLKKFVEAATSDFIKYLP